MPAVRLDEQIRLGINEWCLNSLQPFGTISLLPTAPHVGAMHCRPAHSILARRRMVGPYKPLAGGLRNCGRAIKD
jgi:hypothetical protein